MNNNDNFKKRERNSPFMGPHASSHVLIFTAIGRNTNIPKIIHVFTVFIVDINEISIGIK